MSEKTEKTKSRKRRGRNEGSVYRRADGRWVGCVSLGVGGDGRRRRKVVYGATKAAVMARLDAERSALRSGVASDGGLVTVAELAERWQASGESSGLAASTLAKRAGCLAGRVLPMLGGTRLAALTPSRVEWFYAEMVRLGVGPGARWNNARCLVAMLRYAARLGLVARSPAEGVPVPGVQRREMSCLTAAQAAAVLAACAGRGVGPLVAVALGSGCRQGELLALTWADVDEGCGRLHVRRSLSPVRRRGRLEFLIKEPKTAAGVRSVLLPAFAIAALAGRREVAARAGLLGGTVFCNKDGSHRTSSTIWKAFRRLLASANASGAAISSRTRFYDLRHTAASLLISGGASLRAVATRLGHADPAFTLKIYAHVMPTDDAALAEKLGGIILG